MNCSLFTETEKAYAVTLYEPRKLIRERTRVLQNAVQLYFSARIFAINSTCRGSNVSVFLMREEWNPYICIKAKSAVRQRVIKALLFKIFFTIHMFCLCTYENLYTLYENCGNETLNIKHQG